MFLREPFTRRREAAGEASVATRVGGAIELRALRSRIAETVSIVDGNTGRGAMVRRGRASRRRRPGHARTSLVGTSEVFLLSWMCPRPNRNGRDPTPMMHDRKKSDSAIVCAGQRPDQGGSSSTGNSSATAQPRCSPPWMSPRAPSSARATGATGPGSSSTSWPGDRGSTCRRPGHPHRHGQLLNPQDCGGEGLAGAAAALACPFHADLGVVDQSGRTLVRRTDAQAVAARRAPLDAPARSRHPRLHRTTQRGPEPLQVDEIRRRHPRRRQTFPPMRRSKLMP